MKLFVAGYVILTASVILDRYSCARGFVIIPIVASHKNGANTDIALSRNINMIRQHGDVFVRLLSKKEDNDLWDESGEELNPDDTPSSSVVLGDLSWRVEKLRLEELNTKRFLKARPVFLPYDECRKWVAAWGWWESEEEWRDWIDTGEKRNSYIPACPDEYYGRLGQWISWSHFLGSDDIQL